MKKAPILRNGRYQDNQDYSVKNMLDASIRPFAMVISRWFASVWSESVI